MIPDVWKLSLVRDGGWKAYARKIDGVREVTIDTYNDPKSTVEEALALLEEKIKL